MNQKPFFHSINILFSSGYAVIHFILCHFLVPLIALPILFGGNMRAQTVPQDSYSAMYWRMIGPFRAGRALAACGIPGKASTFYFGSVDGGV